GHVGDVRLRDRGDRRVLVLTARDEVGDEDERVLGRVRRGAVELDGEVRRRGVVRGGRALDDRGRGLVGERDVLVADLDLRDPEVTGTRRGRVADRAGGGVDGLDDARRALRARAGRVRERVG